MMNRIRQLVAAARRLRDERFTMVYTMGKVGSTAIERRLDAAYHTHTLYGRPPCPPYHLYKFGAFKVWLRRFGVYPLKRALLRLRPFVRIVTFYRDPKGRNPSMFMQDLPYWLTYDAAVVGGASSREEAGDYLVEAYRRVFPHDYPMYWVQHELARFTGIAPEELMLGDAAFKVVRRGRYAVFIGRIESLSECLDELSEFAGRTLTDVGETNRGARKWYGPLYQPFVDGLRDNPDIEYSPGFRRANGYADV
jgi:hypothetical protein